jgi:hypothetical protein
MTLRDFIASRKAEIRDQQRALKTELKELLLAEAALDPQSEVTSASTGLPPLTIKEMARQVLAGQPNGLNSSGILDAIKKMFDRDLERTSLSPQLSRLKEEGELVLNGDTWFTKENHDEWISRAFSGSADDFQRWADSVAEEAPGAPAEGEGEDDEPIF